MTTSGLAEELADEFWERINDLRQTLVKVKKLRGSVSGPSCIGTQMVDIAREGLERDDAVREARKEMSPAERLKMHRTMGCGCGFDVFDLDHSAFLQCGLHARAPELLRKVVDAGSHLTVSLGEETDPLREVFKEIEEALREYTGAR